MTKRLLSAALCIGLVLGGVGPVQAQENAGRRAALVLKILSYVKNLSSRVSGNSLTILVVYERGNSQSEAVMQATNGALNALGRRSTVAGMHARAEGHAFVGQKGLTGAIRRTGAVAVFVCPGLEGKAAKVAHATRLTDVISMGMSSQSVRAGISVGLVSKGSGIELLVNMQGAKREGVHLGAEMLRLAEVVR